MLDLSRILSPPRATGYILHEDNDRVTIATLRSENAKTGDMIQVWILARHIHPVSAVQTGADALVCGDCKLRGSGFRDRLCYVTVHQGPANVWGCYSRGRYPALREPQYPDVFHAQPVRLGAYGDPVYIPIAKVRQIAWLSRRWTGYTHQWRQPAYQDYRSLLMASVDSPAEHALAHAMGWRTFRLRLAHQPLCPGEITCPASAEAGHRTTCAACGLCNGHRADDRADIAILPHGAMVSRRPQSLIQIGG